jgi:hypothetical protein
MTEEKWTKVKVLNKICQLILISDKYDNLRISQFIVNLASKNDINFYTEDSELLEILNKEDLF